MTLVTDPATIAPESLRWTVRLSEGNPRKVAGVVAAALLAGVVGWAIMGNPILAAFGILMVLGPSSEFLLPIRYSVTAQGASSRWGVNTTMIAWQDVRRVVKGDSGIKLSPLEKPGRMSAFRGVYLRFGKENRQEIERAVAYWCQSHESVG